MPREEWNKSYDFLFSLVGFSVGFGNIWRFPYLCFKHGGGAFLIPYFVSVVLMGLVMLMLEVALGQFMGTSCVNAWKIVPLFEGIGYANLIISQWLCIYYIVIIAWSFYYLFSCFTSELPWSHCGNTWNTAACYVPSAYQQGHNWTAALQNATGPRVGAGQEFWERKVLRMSDGIEDVGAPVWDLSLCLLLSWIVCYLSAFKGIRLTAKVLYVSTTFPYVFLLILVIRSLTLDGAIDGLAYAVDIKLQTLAEGHVWHDAATQALFSFSIGLGTLTTLGSYNRYHMNMYRSCVLFTVVNVLTSLLACAAIFAAWGFLAKNQGVSIDEFAASGPGMAFIIYPDAVSGMPISPLWAVCFFLVMVLVGIDSQFVCLLGFITSAAEAFPQYVGKGLRKQIFFAVICAIWFLIGLSMVTKGGIYVFHLFDVFTAGGPALLLVASCETIAIAWIFGVDTFHGYVCGMNGYLLDSIFKPIWKYLTPVFCLGVFFFSLATAKPLTYNDYGYPAWALVVGWLMTASSILVIPAVAIAKFIATQGTFRERWAKLTTVVLPQSIRELEEKENPFSSCQSKSSGPESGVDLEMKNHDLSCVNPAMDVES